MVPLADPASFLVAALPIHDHIQEKKRRAGFPAARSGRHRGSPTHRCRLPPVIKYWARVVRHRRNIKKIPCVIIKTVAKISIEPVETAAIPALRKTKTTAATVAAACRVGYIGVIPPGLAPPLAECSRMFPVAVFKAAMNVRIER